jgi:Transglycosylase SLT domain
VHVRARFVAVALVLVAGSGSVAAAVGAHAGDDEPRTAAATAAVAATAVPGTSAAPSPPVAGQAPVVRAAVRPLGALRVPDLYITARRPLSSAQVAALRRMKGVTALAVLDAGPATVAGGPARVVGVDPSEFRGFTPQETASSDPLWANVANSEVAVDYAFAHTRKVTLATTVAVAGGQRATDRVGALAAFGLPDVDVVTDRAGAASYGLPSATAVVLSAPSRGTGSLVAEVRQVVGSAGVQVLRPKTVTPSRHRPGSYRELYISSARYCPGLHWQVLAAIGQVESDHGRNAGVSSAGAMGPMQFLPSTWATYGVDGDGDGKADIQSPFDAVPSAALYLCRNGAGRGGAALYGAIFAYNHADWYVREVLAIAATFR